MKSISLAFVLAILSMALGAQSVSPQVLASAGGFFTNSTNSVSYTVGEMTMVQTFSSNSIVLTQGFQQTNDDVTGILNLSQDDFGSFVAYPNPVNDVLSYAFQFGESGKVTIAIYNDLGQKTGDIYTANYDNGKTTQKVNVSAYAAGLYFLTLSFVSATNNQTHIVSKKFQVIN